MKAGDVRASEAPQAIGARDGRASSRRRDRRQTCEVNARQHDLALACNNELSRLNEDLIRRRRTRGAATEGNDAKCAAMIAAVLDREKPARRAFAGADRPLLSFEVERVVADGARDFFFASIADDARYAFVSTEASSSICAAQPVTMIVASGRSRCRRRMACRAWGTDSLVTAQVLTTTVSLCPPYAHCG